MAAVECSDLNRSLPSLTTAGVLGQLSRQLRSELPKAYVWILLSAWLILLLHAVFTVLLLATFFRQHRKRLRVYPFHILLLLTEFLSNAVSIIFVSLRWGLNARHRLAGCLCPFLSLATAWSPALITAFYLSGSGVLVLALVDRLLALKRPITYQFLCQDSRRYFAIAALLTVSSLALSGVTVPSTTEALNLPDGSPRPFSAKTEVVCAWLQVSNHTSHLLWWHPHICVHAPPASRFPARLRLVFWEAKSG